MPSNDILLSQWQPKYFFVDFESFSSEEVESAIQKLKGPNVEEDGPGAWFINMKTLEELKPRIVLVQNTCDICDFRQNDDLLTLRRLRTEEKPKQTTTTAKPSR